MTTIYTLRQAADRMCVDEKTARKEIREGRLVARKYGRKTLVDADAISAWFDQLPAAKAAS